MQKKVSFDPSLKLFPEKPTNIMKPSDKEAHNKRNSGYTEEQKKFNSYYKIFLQNLKSASFKSQEYNNEELINMHLHACKEYNTTSQRLENNQNKLKTIDPKDPLKNFTYKCTEKMIENDILQKNKIETLIKEIDYYFEESEAPTKKIKTENKINSLKN